MALSFNVPDLGTSQAEFIPNFVGFHVSKQSDGAGGTAAMATLSMNIPYEDGSPYKQASYTVELGPSATNALLNFMLSNMLPGLKSQEGV
jgi:hypothetical protein